ncbi:MAG: glycosyltransferase family 2 protein [Oscillospiraceae bacterium]
MILPAYNAEKYLKRSAGSVLAQTFTDLELIIVDDGSVDETAQICARLAQSDNRVRVLRQKNSGVSVSRNLGISAATGDYVAFVDADDSLYETAYADMFSAIDANDCDCAVCGYFDENPDGTRCARPAPMKTGAHDYRSVQQKIILPLLQDRLSENLLLGTVWRYLFRRDVIVSHAITFSGSYLEDEIFLIEYFSYPCRLASVNKPLYNYLQNPASVTKRYLPTFIETFKKTMAIKASLIEKFSIPVSNDWRLNSAWAGLLIAVSNEFAPGNPGSGLGRVREIVKLPLFAEAIKKYRPEGMNRNKTIAAFCLQHGQYTLLAALYSVKNRRRH